ncbi:MAG: DNA gyrase subunit A [Clostridiales bacterium]|jgi:DNA gyrase subunit A|nr:DNA gyrase subunit A [Clostridiales bacterium]
MDEQQQEKIVLISLEEEMRNSYIDYAMSVIVARALPDVRDGLKPVHRRILYSMNELNLEPNKAYKKSARIVGDTMGKYHPHGESSIYDAMVRMAQDFSMRYMLVDGHGNFGSVDGDMPAAPRYTEARLSRISVEMLADIDKETVDFMPNYDEELREPTVLPARFPQLLVNGSSGIAVGMATNIPPHNLREAIDAVVKIIDNRIIENRETDISELLEIIKGPDYPTGAVILGTSGVKQAYRTGHGRVVVRSVSEIEPMSGGRDRIVITELPYQVNKERLVEKIGTLVNEKKIDGISDVRDESDREGMRVVIELRRDVNANVILNKLYKNSQLQESYGINMLALVDNKPLVINLLDMLLYYLEHQKDVVSRRIRFDLAKAQKRAHILEGFILALDNIDEVIAIIRASRDTAEARSALSERFGLAEEQAGAIVEMRLRSLTGLERGKIQEEYEEIKHLIEELTAILNDEKLLYGVIKEELLVIKVKFGDERRTGIIHDPGEIIPEDLITDENCVITMTHLNYIKRLPLATYKTQRRGGRGIVGMQTREEDIVKNLFVANSHDYVLFFTTMGRAYRIKVYEIPESGRTARGTAIVNLLNLSGGERIASVVPIKDFKDDEYLLMVTKDGIIKKTAMSHFSNIKKTGIIALNCREGDELITVLRTSGDQEVFIATKKGMGLRFSESEVRPMGRTAAGVRGILLREGDCVVSADTLSAETSGEVETSGGTASGETPEGAASDNSDKIIFVSDNGYGKCTDKEEFTLRHRGGVGLKIYKITEKTGYVTGVARVTDSDELMLINSEGIVLRISVSSISTTGRITSGVKLINLNPGVTVVGMAKIITEL